VTFNKIIDYIDIKIRDRFEEGKVRCSGHGDFWSNNIMFANGANGEPERAVILDFQVLPIKISDLWSNKIMFSNGED
jgi:aminoglycoside/choline kinase family phosphotransferase